MATTRRGFLEGGVSAVCALGLGSTFGSGLLGCGAAEDPSAGASSRERVDPAPQAVPSEAPVTEIRENSQLVQTLRYAPRSPSPEQRCANCALYQPKDDARGRCELFAAGWVHADGWCSAWIAAPAASPG